MWLHVFLGVCVEGQRCECVWEQGGVRSAWKGFPGLCSFLKLSNNMRSVSQKDKGLIQDSFGRVWFVTGERKYLGSFW